MTRWTIIGPTYPFRGGIAHYTTLLTKYLRTTSDTLLISFTRQYPRWLFPGRSDKDPSQNPLQTEAEYLLDPLNPLSWQRTVRRLTAWDPEAVVIPWWVPFWAPAWAFISRRCKRLQSRPKVIFICHNVLPHEERLYDKAALRFALSAGDGYLAHSQADADILHGFFPDTPIMVSPLPTFSELGQGSIAACPVKLPDDIPIIIFFGFIRPYKGLDVLLEALARVHQPVHLLVAGEFWENQAIYESQIKSLGLEEHVTIVNEYLDDDQLAACLDRADLAVLPYKSATQSAVIQTAFGHDLPVITTDVGGLAEVVDDGRTGLVVPPEDPLSLAGAIDRFFQEQMGNQSSINIREDKDRFSWNHLVTMLGILATDPQTQVNQNN